VKKKGKSGNKNPIKKSGVMVGGAMRSAAMYKSGGMTCGTSGKARGMGAAVKGGKFRDL
jgi:hypothetical protein